VPLFLSFFLLLSEMGGSHDIFQTSLELQGSNNLPALASWLAYASGTHHMPGFAITSISFFH
jgi:hypothetical protein